MSETEYRVVDELPELRAKGDKQVLMGRFP